MGQSRSPSIVLIVAACASASVPLKAAQVIEPVEAPVPAVRQLRRAPVESQKPLRPAALLVEQLASPKFAERAQASRDLVRMGAPAVEALLGAAKSDEPERSLRAVSALEDLFLKSFDNDDDAAAEAAFRALDILSLSDDVVLRSRVEAALAANEADLYQYSRDELVRLGASLRVREGISLVADDGKLRPEIEMIQLGAKWQGGVEGLRHVRRIRPAKGLYLIAGVNLPTEAVAKFEAESQIKVQTRGRAQLGIHNNSLLPVRGVAIFEVEPGGAAARGGILSEDVIVEFNGVGIATFEELVKQIELTEPGQTVPVKVVRAKETVELQITMGSWAP
jgi:hypothetical protein